VDDDGRRAVVLRIASVARLGIDLGGTKIEIVALDASGELLVRRRVPTPAHDYDAIVEAIAALVRAVESELGERGTVGVGTPGAISPASGLLKNANTVVLNGKPLRHDLAQALQREVRMANDANCFALSEAVDGAAAGAQVVFGVILGTGTGGGVIVGGRPLVGVNAIAGEWGHSPLPWPTDDERPGPACYCGKAGCIETFLCGPGLRRDHHAHTQEDIDTKEIVSRARAGVPSAEATLERYEDRLARSLATVINLLDPDAIVLGGGVSNIERLYTNVPRLLDRYVFSDRVDTKLVRAHHGDSSGVRGAAWLWPARP
jgi:fructokinase